MPDAKDMPPTAISALGVPGQGLHPSIPKAVREAVYLSTTNAERYRVIMHFFHESYKLQRHRLKTRHIWRYVREVAETDYTMEQCALDLNQLVAFGNLVPEEDRDSVRSLEEWRARDRVFDVTPITIRLEEALEAHRRDGGSRASLDPTLIEMIRAGVKSLTHTMANVTAEQTGNAEWVARMLRRPWLEIHRQFSDLNEGANAFHHALKQAHPADIDQPESLRAYKLVLHENLRVFIVELIDAGAYLRDRMLEWRQQGYDAELLDVLVAFDLLRVAEPGQPRPDEAEVRERYGRQIAGFIGWFLPDGGAETLRRTTRNAIDTAARSTARLTDRHRLGSSRRHDLRRLAAAFARCPSIEAAHCLAAATLGVPTARHIVGSEQWGVMSTGRSVWEQPAHEVPLRAVQRGARPRPRVVPVIDNSAAQHDLLVAEAARRREEQAVWDRLFVAGPIEVSDLAVDAETRDRILDALDACIASPDLSGYASDGSLVRVQMPDPAAPYGRLRTPEGDFFTPRFRLFRAAAAGVAP